MENLDDDININELIIPKMNPSNTTDTIDTITAINNDDDDDDDIISVWSDSLKLNAKLYSLSSIERTNINIKDWINPSIINSNTKIIGYCCEKDNDYNCNLQKFALLFSMSLFPNNSIYFQKCLKNGHSPKSLNNQTQIISIKQRRDLLLNNNNKKIWTIQNEQQFWFMPDLYLCQVMYILCIQYKKKTVCFYFFKKGILLREGYHRFEIKLQ